MNAAVTSEPLTEDNAAECVDRFIREDLPGLTYPACRFAGGGRGIVIAAGGRQFQVNAWVTIHMLRHLKCRLPIECWYLGPEEYDAHWDELVQPLDVRCIDAYEVRER